MTTPRLTALLISACVLGLAPQLHAQTRARLPRPRVCDMRAHIIMLRVVDRTTGEPISRATIVATRTRTGAKLADAAWMGTPGNYLLAGDGDLPGLTAAGEPFDIVITHGAKHVRTTVELGLIADGCHVEMRNGPREIRL